MAESQTTTRVSQVQADNVKPSAKKPTIQDTMSEFASAFEQACQGSDSIDILRDMRRFLNTKNLSPYYRMKACIVLSATDEENEPDENIASTGYWLQKARQALEEAKNTYTYDSDDAKQLQIMEKTIRELEEDHQKRKNVFYSDDSDDEEADY